VLLSQCRPPVVELIPPFGSGFLIPEGEHRWPLLSRGPSQRTSTATGFTPRPGTLMALTLRTALFEDIEVFYNRRRRHSALGYLTLEEFGRRWRFDHKASPYGSIATNRLQYRVNSTFSSPAFTYTPSLPRSTTSRASSRRADQVFPSRCQRALRRATVLADSGASCPTRPRSVRSKSPAARLGRDSSEREEQR
jgi:hypothetical protein